MSPRTSRQPARLCILIGLAALAPLGASAARAQGWEHALSPYLWAAGLTGTTTMATPLGPLDADLDLSFSDILKNLRLGGMVSYEGRNGNWLLLSDLVYLDLRGTRSQDQAAVQTQLRADNTQISWELDGGYFITSRIALYVGARYNSIDADLRVDITTGAGTNRRSASGGASWVDPLVGLYGRFPLTERWSVDLKGDVGGFGAGSEFVWQVTSGVRWKLNDAWDLIASYRYYDVDFEDENSSGLLRYDMVSHGPMLGATWRF